MIAIIPAHLVVFGVDAIDRIVFEVIKIHKSVLCPVAQHHHHTGKNKGDDENKQSGLQVDKAHGNAENVKGHFSRSQPHVKLFPFSAEEIHKGVGEAQYEEAAYIGQEARQ